MNKPYTIFFFVIIIISNNVACKLNLENQKHYTVAKDYQRIALVNIFASTVFWKLGSKARSKVVGIPAIIDDERFSSFRGYWPKEITRIHRAGEEVVVLNPDLVVLASFHSLDFRTMLTKAGIDYIMLKSFAGFTAYRNNVKLLAKVVGLEKKGDELIAQFNQRVKRLQEKTKFIANKKRVVSYMYGNTMGDNSTFDDVAKLAGLINLAALKGKHNYSPISIELLETWMPDIVIISCGRISCTQAEKSFPSKIGLEKVHFKVVAIKSNLITSTGEKMLDFASELIKKVYEIKL